MPDVMKGMRMLPGISTTSSRPVYWCTTRTIRMQHDGNDDGFLDTPLREQVNLMNRWYHKLDNYVAQYGVRYLHESRTGGQATKHHDFTDPYRDSVEYEPGRVIYQAGLYHR